MRQSSGSSTCAYGLPSQAGFAFERRRNAMRQSALARARATPKRKLRDDSDDETQQEKHQKPHVVVDEFGNRVVLDGLKRLRVASPPLPHTSHTTTTDYGDVSMDDSEAPAAIVPVATKTPMLVGPAASSRQYASPATDATLDASDPSCRAMVLFNPYRGLAVERSPRIQLVSDSEKDDEDSSDEESSFVRFEELPDDEAPQQEEDEAEAMELD